MHKIIFMNQNYNFQIFCVFSKFCICTTEYYLFPTTCPRPCRSAVKHPMSHRPRLLLAGHPGAGQTSHLAPAVLHSLECFTVHSLDSAVLFGVSSTSPEEACAQVTPQEAAWSQLLPLLWPLLLWVAVVVWHQSRFKYKSIQKIQPIEDSQSLYRLKAWSLWYYNNRRLSCPWLTSGGDDR